MISKFSKAQWLIISVHSFSLIMAGSTISLQGPFYPMIAEEKGVTPTQYGMVFGVFYMILFFVCPFTGVLITRFGAVEINLLGLIIIGISNIMFGFVYLINGVEFFLGVSILIRILEAVGFAVFRNAIIAIIFCEFYENVEMALALVQVLVTVGLSLGPVIGGALYEWGGFFLPFVVVGAFILCAAFAGAFLPRDYPRNDTKLNMDILKLLKLPLIIVAIFTIFLANINIGCNNTILEPHLRSLNLTPVEVGSFFLCNAVSFSISGLVFGKFCEIYEHHILVCSFSALFVICGFALLGPAPYLYLDMSIYTSVFGVLIQGIGTGGEQITGFSLLHKGAKLANLPKNIQTFGIISAIFTTFKSLGLIVGPFLGGYLFEIFKFPLASQFFIPFHLILCIGCIVYNCFQLKNHEENNEKTLLCKS